MNEMIPAAPFNRKAIIAFATAILALISLCVGVLPIPFLELACYPSALILGIAALVLGIWAQVEVRMKGGGGKTLAVIAVWTGVLTLIALGCIAAFLAAVIPRLYDFVIHFLKQYDLNPF